MHNFLPLFGFGSKPYFGNTSAEKPKILILQIVDPFTHFFADGFAYFDILLFFESSLFVLMVVGESSHNGAVIGIVEFMDFFESLLLQLLEIRRPQHVYVVVLLTLREFVQRCFAVYCACHLRAYYCGFEF